MAEELLPLLTQHNQGPFATRQHPRHRAGVCSTATTNPWLHQLLPDWGCKGLWSHSGEAQGCSGLQKAHPQPGCQFHPKPHLQA